MVGESNDSWGNSKKHLGSATKFRILYLPGTRHETEKKISLFIEFTWPSLLLTQCDAIPMWFVYRNQVPLLEFYYYYYRVLCGFSGWANKILWTNIATKIPNNDSPSEGQIPQISIQGISSTRQGTRLPVSQLVLNSFRIVLYRCNEKSFSGEFFSGHLYKGQVGTWDKTRST